MLGSLLYVLRTRVILGLDWEEMAGNALATIVLVAAFALVIFEAAGALQ
ncbi:MAG: hypothetical protein ACRDFS_10955 [Chloroflexota bacterium]